jgi:peptidoglycan-associated lipoprotein
VKDFLLKEGVSTSSFKTISYGAERPVCSDDNDACYQKNRHAAFTFDSGS